MKRSLWSASKELTHYLRSMPTSDAMEAAADRIDELEKKIEKLNKTKTRGGRAVFEKELKKKAASEGKSPDSVNLAIENGNYVDESVRSAWWGFQEALISVQKIIFNA